MTLAMFVLACLLALAAALVVQQGNGDDDDIKLFSAAIGVCIASALALAVLSVVRFFMEVT